MGSREERWLRDGPTIDELVAERKDGRKGGRKDLAIVIPTYRNGRMLRAHIDTLSRQTYQDFDIVIVYGEQDGFIEGMGWASILHIREKGRNGTAGAYYLGEKCALQEGYSYVVLADDDCVPRSDRLLETIDKSLRRGGGVAMPLLSDSPPGVRAGGIHQYAGMGREVLEEVGLTFFPFYTGGEDSDLLWRLRLAGIRVEFQDVAVGHPRGEPFVLADLTDLHHYTRGNIHKQFLRRDYGKAMLAMFVQLMRSLSFLVMGRWDVAKSYMRTALSISAMRFFRERGDEDGGRIASAAEDADASGFELLEYSDGRGRFGIRGYRDPAKGWGAVLGLGRDSLSDFLDIGRYLSKDLLFVDWVDTMDISIMLMGRSSYLRYQDRMYRVTGERSGVVIVLGLGFMVLAAPVVAAVAAALAASGFLNMARKNIRSEGYAASNRGAAVRTSGIK